MYWMQTYSGRKVDLEYPQPDDIVIEDIAHALSMTCRFGGHCKGFYSVAEHSLLVEKVLETNLPYSEDSLASEPQGLEEWATSFKKDKTLSLAALLHDAAEAYLGDLITPLKKIITRETYLEGRWLDTIQEKLKLPVAINPMPKNVAAADRFMLTVEAHTLFSTLHPDWDISKRLPKNAEKFLPQCLPPAVAETAFLSRFHELAALP